MATGASQPIASPEEATVAFSWVTLISARDGVSGTVKFEYCPIPALVKAAIFAV